MTHERIEINPEVMNGKPVICGTRVPVELVLRKLRVVLSLEAIIDEHPRLKRDDIVAVQAIDAGLWHGVAVCGLPFPPVCFDRWLRLDRHVARRTSRPSVET